MELMLYFSFRNISHIRQISKLRFTEDILFCIVKLTVDASNAIFPPRLQKLLYKNNRVIIKIFEALKLINK